jgi:hypothetical protein
MKSTRPKGVLRVGRAALDHPISSAQSENVLTQGIERTMRPPRVTAGSSAQEASLRRVVLDAAYFGGMVGCGETYFPAFVVSQDRRPSGDPFEA